ncbi:hypothetical protein BC936DRAFT_137595 [Jimgerdemannia flammicorona]|uniref:Uncharacterized protein n=1 Tax=Jimgerdemannia flammicorona TaxID=994334 RepID=A0A433CWZ6_9FUNG|nr:hypothetical protein BC936DRAFT_137595 [Jimgerdemannia flammicorona]
MFSISFTQEDDDDGDEMESEEEPEDEEIEDVEEEAGEMTEIDEENPPTDQLTIFIFVCHVMSSLTARRSIWPLSHPSTMVWMVCNCVVCGSKFMHIFHNWP